MRKILVLIVALAAFAGGAYGVKYGFAWVKNYSSGVRMSTKPWTDHTVLNGKVKISTPFPVSPSTMELPEETTEVIRWVAHYSGGKEGILVNAGAVSYRPGVPLSLDNAVEGALAGVKGAPGNTDFDSSREEKMLLGERAVEVKAIMLRNGKLMEIHAIFVIEDGVFYQFMLANNRGNKESEAVWNRMRDSIAFAGEAKGLDRTLKPGSPPVPSGMKRRE